MQRILIPLFVGLYCTIVLVSFFVSVNEVVYLLRSISSTLFYLGTAMVLWLERERLAIYNLDRFSMIMILLGGTFFRRRLGITFDLLSSFITWSACISILILILIAWRKIPKVKLEWFLVGIIATVLSLLPIAFLESMNVGKDCARFFL